MLNSNKSFSLNSNGGSKKIIFPLHEAAKLADFKTLQEIINSKRDLDVNQKDPSRKTPLSYLVTIIKENKNKASPQLVEKVKNARLCINILIEASANINNHFIVFEAVERYIKFDDSSDFDHIIKYGKEVNWNGRCNQGDPLLTALNNNHTEIVKKLISLGADVIRESGLYKVIKHDKWEILEYILENVECINSNYKIDKESLFSIACTWNSSQVITLLIKHGAKIQPYNPYWRIKEKDYNRMILLCNYSLNHTCAMSDYIKLDISSDNKFIIKKLLGKSFSALVDMQSLTNVYNEMLQNPILYQILCVNACKKEATIEFVGLMPYYITDKEYVGITYSNKRMVIADNGINEVKKDTLAHEMTHSMFYILNNDTALPYVNKTQKKAYEKAIFKILDNLALYYIGVPSLEYLNYFGENYTSSTHKYGSLLASITRANIHSTDPAVKKLSKCILNVFKLYKPREEHDEIIVLFPQTLASHYGNNETVQKILTPLKDYWQEYVTPRIDAFLEASKT